jgi:hypothetical protein
MTPMALTEDVIMAHLDALRHGGKEAITLFMEMSKRLHEGGAKDALQDWVTIAAPALPEKERNEVLVTLMCSYLFLNWSTQARMDSGTRAPTYH